jgi:hypothetical protein
VSFFCFIGLIQFFVVYLNQIKKQHIMKLIEINERREWLKNRRNEGKITLLNLTKHLETLDRLEAKLKN